VETAKISHILSGHPCNIFVILCEPPDVEDDSCEDLPYEVNGRPPDDDRGCNSSKWKNSGLTAISSNVAHGRPPEVMIHQPSHGLSKNLSKPPDLPRETNHRLPWSDLEIHDDDPCENHDDWKLNGSIASSNKKKSGRRRRR